MFEMYVILLEYNPLSVMQELEARSIAHSFVLRVDLDARAKVPCNSSLDVQIYSTENRKGKNIAVKKYIPLKAENRAYSFSKPEHSWDYAVIVDTKLLGALPLLMGAGYLTRALREDKQSH
jgi:hypothetical protein